MNETLAIIVLCVNFLFFIEGIDTAFTKKANKVYKITHILYPAIAIIIMLYFIAIGLYK
ncbi:hypothetical protein H8S37_04160 [Mediterraneibacter sp. NSJ-55]|uniref:Uncharacterized protein n=1 Tax=Mediterraneibacter hominis TaxID=2763054 RepID=A0A923RR82_9FIRM|nr:hypothetical protein [Mediterraneibacter hominis]MBC5688127.1 hypothetical protein [Mediterraneibacter hominis]